MSGQDRLGYVIENPCCREYVLYQYIVFLTVQFGQP
jgi:hypothetical protein